MDTDNKVVKAWGGERGGLEGVNGGIKWADVILSTINI